MIEIFDQASSTTDVVSALLRDGGVIISKQTTSEVVDRVLQGLRKPFDEQGKLFENDFNGYTTLRGKFLLLNTAWIHLLDPKKPWNINGGKTLVLCAGK